MRRKTTEQFKKEVKELVGKEYTVIGKYIKANIHIQMRHNECGYEYKVTPSSFLSGARCPKCFGNFKKTTEQFKNEVKKIVGDKYKVLGEYKNAHTKIKMKHRRCGYIYKVTPSHFLHRGSRCPNCFGTFKKTTAEFKEELFNMYGDEYIVLEEYKNAHTKIKIKHQCGFKYKVKPNNILSGKGCPACNRKDKQKRYSKGLDQFKIDVKNSVGNEYTILGKYKNAKTPIKIKHNKCGNIYYETPDNFLNSGSRCPECHRFSKMRTHKQFIKDIKNLYFDEYKILGHYENLRKKILVRHNPCNYEWKSSPDNLLRGYGCPNCAGNIKKTTAEFKNEVYNLVGNEYTVLGEYINADEKIKINHNICGYLWNVRAQSILSGTRCPKCSNSKIEAEFYKLLINIGLKENKDFKYNKKIEGCKLKKHLRFDFKINVNDHDFYLIELDGEFHYKPIMGENPFKKQRKRDRKKDEFCKKEKIKLIRIPYWNFDDIKSLIEREDISFIKSIKNGTLESYLENKIQYKNQNIVQI